MRWASAVQHAMLVRRLLSFPQQDASGNSPAAGRMGQEIAKAGDGSVLTPSGAGEVRIIQAPRSA